MTFSRLLLLCFALAIAACSRAPDEQARGGSLAKDSRAQIAWVRPESSAEMNAVFERSRATKQPVFLFWTATWCPPCNHVKSTIFTRDDFIARTRNFIPVYIDGDKPGSQSLGRRFKVSGYPTMVLLNADGAELTRLTGSVEPDRYLQLLDFGTTGETSASATLAAALEGNPLSPHQWRLLAYHAWETDDEQLVAERDVPQVLMKLATTCPPTEREAASRLVMQALLAAATTKSEASKINKADARASVLSLLKQPDLVREHHDLFSFAADDITGFLTTANSSERAQLVAAWQSALDRLANDRSLGNAAQVWVTSGKIALARLDHKQGLPEPLLAEARAAAARADRETTDLNERQSVITSAGGMLSRAGLYDEAAALMKAELARSHSPYYYMLGLAANERRRATPQGNQAAIDWARQAYLTSVGPATRVEWGSTYLRYLIDLAPGDADQIESAAHQVVGELQAPGAFSGRTQRTLERASDRLKKWSGGRHDERLRRINQRFASVCGQAAEATDRSQCESLFLPSHG